jgi:hypothetical protein
MALLTQSFMQTFLTTAFAVPSNFVVPRQGNWYNPQASASDGHKPNTWCAYLVKKTRARALPYYELADDHVSNQSTVPVISDIDVQLVGSEAETAAMSMMHWLNRPDLTALLVQNGMQLVGQPADIIVSAFMQDGMNNVLAYNGVFSIQWDNFVTSTAQQLTSVTLPLTDGVIVVNP